MAKGSLAYYHELREALGQPGCFLCRVLTDVANKYLDSILWGFVNDPRVREEINKARGYCPQHGWLLVRHGAALGAAILMEDVIQTALKALEAEAIAAPGRFSLREMGQRLGGTAAKQAVRLADSLSPQIPCPICVKVNASEKYYIQALLEHLTGPESLAAAYQASDGPCLPHFRLVLSKTGGGATLAALVEAQKAVWQRLQGELAEFIRKNDHRFQHEPFGPERDSWLRAIEAVSGAPPRASGSNKSLTEAL
jgi:hypothetical protein